MVATRSHGEWLLIFDADEYVMIGLGAERENANGRVLKTLQNQRHREGYDDVRFRYITMSPSGNACILERVVPEACNAKCPSQKSNVKSAPSKDLDWLVTKIHFQRGKFLPRTFANKITIFTAVTLEDGADVKHYQLRTLECALLKKKPVSSSIEDKNLANRDFIETGSLGRPRLIQQFLTTLTVYIFP